MEKVQVNNQIISMRKLVKQAKVHVINKLVKEVKHLKAKKGDEAKTAKYHRKAERLLLEMNLIKKMNVDAVSKKALSSNENWKHIISEKSVSLEERAMARLLCFDSVQNEVQQFDSKYPHLVKILPDLIQQWEAKKRSTSPGTKELKAAEIKKVKKERRLKRKLARNDHDVSVTPTVENKPETPEKENDIPSSSDEFQESERISLDGVHNTDLLSGQEKENNGEASMNTKNQDRRGRHVLPKLSNSNCSDKFNPRAKYGHKFKKHLYMDNSVKKIGKPKGKAIIGGLSNRTAKKQVSSSHWKGTGANSEPCLLKNRKSLDCDMVKPKFDDSRNQKNLTSSDQKKNSLQHPGKKISTTTLHPSWEAKRKMNIQASNLSFQGKKIKFDE